MVLLVEAMPMAILGGVLGPAVAGPPRRRRSRFRLRFAGVVIAIWLPIWVAVLGALVASIPEQIAGPLLIAGMLWGVLIAAISGVVLFGGPESDPGSADGDDDGPGPGNDWPTPPAPVGGIPLLDAESSSTRLRDHPPPRRGQRPRRPVRQRERVMLWLRAFRPWSSWRPV